MTYDVIIVGAGAMGSAAAYHLARRGKRVLALDRFGVPNELGSSHGLTRIIRLAYYEHPSYVPLLIRAFELWRELEHESGERLLHLTGAIDAGPPEGEVIQGSLRACEIYRLPHEVLTSAELTQRFPAYRLPATTMAVLQPDGGFLLPEACIGNHARLARSHSAEVRANEPVIDWEPTPNGIRVRTPVGAYEAERLVVSAGSWLGSLVPSVAHLFTPERQVLAWFGLDRPEW